MQETSPNIPAVLLLDVYQTYLQYTMKDHVEAILYPYRLREKPTIIYQKYKSPAEAIIDLYLYDGRFCKNLVQQA